MDCLKHILMLFLVSIFINECFGQSTDLLIQKSGSSTALFDGVMSYIITISNSGTAVSNASFLDDFPANVTNVTLVNCTTIGGAICPTLADYNINNTSFSGVIPFLPHASSVVFTISLNAPTLTNGITSISNTATVSVPAGFTELDPSTNSSTWNTTLITNIDVGTSISSSNINPLGNCTSLPFTTDYTIKWFNNGVSSDFNTKLQNNILFSNIQSLGSAIGTYGILYDISNIQWHSNRPLTNPPPITTFTQTQNTAFFLEVLHLFLCYKILLFHISKLVIPLP